MTYMTLGIAFWVVLVILIAAVTIRYVILQGTGMIWKPDIRELPVQRVEAALPDRVLTEV